MVIIIVPVQHSACNSLNYQVCECDSLLDVSLTGNDESRVCLFTCCSSLTRISLKITANIIYQLHYKTTCTMFNILTDCGEKYGGPEKSNLLNPKETTANRKCCKKHTNTAEVEKTEWTRSWKKHVKKCQKAHVNHVVNAQVILDTSESFTFSAQSIICLSFCHSFSCCDASDLSGRHYKDVCLRSSASKFF